MVKMLQIRARIVDSTYIRVDTNNKQTYDNIVKKMRYLASSRAYSVSNGKSVYYIYKFVINYK